MAKSQMTPEAGDKFYPCLESEKQEGKLTVGRAGKAALERGLKALTIKQVFHQTAVPEGAAPTWCVTVKENDVVYDAAWSPKLKHWVYGGANSGIRG